MMDNTVASAASEIDAQSYKGSGTGADDSSDSNTALYVIGGLGLLAVVGIGGWMWYKRTHPAQV